MALYASMKGSVLDLGLGGEGGTLIDKMREEELLRRKKELAGLSPVAPPGSLANAPATRNLFGM